MLSLVDIKKAIVAKLKILGVNVIANEIKSGFKKPAFFVKITPLNTNSGSDMHEKLITVNIHYFSDDKTDLDNLKINYELEKIFFNSLKVVNRVLTLYEKRSEIEEILQFKFDIRYTEEFYRESIDTYDPIGDIQFKVN